jgi:ubiquinone/menaquinone biosynthesis C-methylase UbiE
MIELGLRNDVYRRPLMTALDRLGLREGWRCADVGAGGGDVSVALAEIVGRDGRVYAVDSDRRAVDALHALARRLRGAAAVTPVAGDFTAPLALPALDGAVLANALHFVPDLRQAAVLARVASQLRAGGRVVVIEYEGRSPSRWVPYPVSLARLRALAAEAGLGVPAVIGERRSAYGGTMYAAMLAPASDV